jgi:hypothetical protein
MHQGPHVAGHEPVIDEHILVNVETVIAALEIAGTVTGDAVPQDEVLRARRRAYRIRLHEAEPVQRALQGGGPEERP